MEGKRPDVSSGGDHGNKWFAGQLDILSHNGFLPEEAGIYTKPMININSASHFI